MHNVHVLQENDKRERKRTVKHMDEASQEQQMF